MLAKKLSNKRHAGATGGSIRVPATFNGLYGFKPSGKRVPVTGWECTMIGNDPIPAVAGPLGHSVEDLDLFFKIVSDAEPWFQEPMIEMPWKTDDQLNFNPDRLKIGVMVWDEVVMPHPYITRVINEVAAKLKAAGHDGEFVLGSRYLRTPLTLFKSSSSSHMTMAKHGRIFFSRCTLQTVVSTSGIHWPPVENQCFPPPSVSSMTRRTNSETFTIFGR